MAKPKMAPQVHSKAAATGKGVVAKTPGNAKSVGPSNHKPVHGQSAAADYSSQQQQQ